MRTSCCLTACTIAAVFLFGPSQALLAGIATDPVRTTRFESGFGGTIHRLGSGAQGRIYVAGQFTGVLESSGMNLGRFSMDLMPDPQFRPAVIEGGPVVAVAEQPDGRVVIAGEFTAVGGANRVRVARLNRDGSLDTSFALTTPPDGAVHAVVLQPDGRILIGGSFRQVGAFVRPRVARLNPDGSLDEGYRVEGATAGRANALALTPDGGCYVGGLFDDVYGPGPVRSALIKVKGDGSLDLGFSYSWGGSNEVLCLARQPDGKLLVGSVHTDGHPSLFRIHSNGGADATFAVGTGFDGNVNDVDLLDDGRIMVTGSFRNYQSTACPGLALLRADARRESQFAPSDLYYYVRQTQPLQDGTFLVSTDNSSVSELAVLKADGTPLRARETARSHGRVQQVVRAPDGGWFVRGEFTHVNGALRGPIVRLRADGSVDEQFYCGEQVHAVLNGMAGTPDGGLVVTSDGDIHYLVRYGHTVSSPNLSIIRFKPDGTVDLDFAKNMVASSFPRDVGVQSDGKIIVVGQFWGLAAYGIARFNPDGTHDDSFEVGAGFDAIPSRVLIEPDGHIVALGEFTLAHGWMRGGIARLMANGALDPTFTTGAGFEGYVYGATRDRDGNYLVWGDLDSYDGLACPDLVRLRPGGARDTSLAFDASEWALLESVAVDSENQMWVTGLSELSSWRIAVMGSSGAVETSLEIPQDTGFPAVTALIADDNGQVFGAGGTNEYNQILSGRFARLVESGPPIIVRAPADVTASVGGEVVLSVAAAGAGLSYQWFKDGAPIAGATSPELRMSAVTWIDSGSYTVRVANTGGSVESAAARLSGAALPPTIVVPPRDEIGLLGRSVTLNVDARGTGPLTYQWRHHGMPVEGATASSLEIPSVHVADAGFYDVIVADGLSVTRSPAGRLAVTPAVNPVRLRPDRGFHPRFEVLGGTLVDIVSSPDGSAHYVLARTTIPGPRISTQVMKLDSEGMEDSGFAPPSLSLGEVQCAVVQPDGKVIVGGDFTLVDGVAHPPIVRLHPDGSRDPSFALSGIAAAKAIALLPDGKILVAYPVDGATYIGRFSAGGSADQPRLIRLPGEGRWVSAILVLPGGGMVVTGDLGWPSGATTGRWIAQFAADGTLDPTFVQAAQIWSAPAAIVVDKSGRLLVAHHHSVVRLMADGTHDPSFAPPSAVERVSDLLLNSDGSVMAAADFYDLRAAAVRISATGNIVDAYHAGNTHGGSLGGVRSFAALQAGGFLLGGDHGYSGIGETVEVIRVNADLDRDLRYGVQLRSEGAVRAVASARDGSMVVVGEFSRVNGVRRSGVARLFPDGSLDPDFAQGAGSSPMFSAGEAPLNIRGVKIDPSGRVLVAGAFRECAGAVQPGVARLFPDGRRDASFVPYRGGVGDAYVPRGNAVELLADGCYMVWGSFMRQDLQWSEPLARLNLDGSRDGTFTLGSEYISGVGAMLPLGDGRIITTGRATSGTYSLFTRLLPTGARDDTFAGPMGQSPSPDFVWQMADGRLVYDHNGAFYRISAEGAADVAFSNAANGLSDVSSCVSGPGGSLIVGGRIGGTTQVLACRLGPDGRRDATFSVEGYVPIPSDYRDGSSLAWDNDGALLAGRYWTVFEGFQGRGLVRLVDTRAPTVLSDPKGALLAPGDSFTLAVDVVGDPVSYRWYRNGRFLSETSGPTLTVVAADEDDLGSYSARVTNSYGSVWTRSAQIVGDGVMPVIDQQPASLIVEQGSPAHVGVVISAPAFGVRCQWQFRPESAGDPLDDASDFRDIPGASGLELRLASTQMFHAGLYRVVVSSGFQQITSTDARVTVRNAPASTSRLLNLSTRALCQTGDNVLIPGFYIAGAGTKRLLMRAVGPELTGFGVPGALPDPQMVLKRQSDGTVVATNEDWGSNTNWTEIRDTAAALYAFPLTEGSKSAALLVDLPAGGYTIVSSGHGDETGVSIVELYDASSATDAARLINISNRGFVGVGGEIMIPGFVVSDEGSRTFLIRAVGPTLGAFGVSGVLADPKIEVYKRRPGTAIDDLILTNDTWGENGDAAQVRQTADAVYAFGLTEGSKDAAFVVTLPPGAYTVNAKGVGDTTGVALVEVYLVP